ncbi:hypothetical protein [Actinomycetospora soli]|uniref:hypothetical protein n=1 Tax=Actinomycetospora soli TaxID=2893887 RepID=UPI001E58C455|nr:hypothetical protein [Actinomycetospora soli]MCD2191635.1 hypothetical protein [Actinomycetospora soli]
MSEAQPWYLSWKLSAMLLVLAVLLVALQFLQQPIDWGGVISFALVAIPIAILTVLLFKNRHRSNDRTQST